MRSLGSVLAAFILVATAGMAVPAGVAARERMITLNGTATRSVNYSMAAVYSPRQGVYLSIDYRVPRGKGGTCTVKVYNYQRGRSRPAAYRVSTTSHVWQFHSKQQVWATTAVFPSRSVAMTFKVGVVKGSHCEYRAWAMQPNRA